ncbi:MAG TPA: hypothetical protein VM759_07170 [Longimicrobium sp.]|nr:hypothetical protein [Longimicrobium sp.]
MRRTAVLSLSLALAACAAPARGPAPAPPPPAAPPATLPAPPPPIAQFESVWTRTAGAQLRTEAGGIPLPYVFMRLEVLRADTAELLVRCIHCPGTPEGWLGRENVVHAPRPPETAARLDLAEFVLAVRTAASMRDVEALRGMMARDFVHSLGPIDMGLLETFAAWEREQYTALDRMPFVLDRGVAAVIGTSVWAGPPEYAADHRFGDLRAGFRRGAQGWQWIFLVRGGS